MILYNSVSKTVSLFMISYFTVNFHILLVGFVIESAFIFFDNQDALVCYIGEHGYSISISTPVLLM